MVPLVRPTFNAAAEAGLREPVVGENLDPGLGGGVAQAVINGLAGEKGPVQRRGPGRGRGGELQQGPQLGRQGCQVGHALLRDEPDGLLRWAGLRGEHRAYADLRQGSGQQRRGPVLPAAGQQDGHRVPPRR